MKKTLSLYNHARMVLAVAEYKYTTAEDIVLLLWGDDIEAYGYTKEDEQKLLRIAQITLDTFPEIYEDMPQPDEPNIDYYDDSLDDVKAMYGELGNDDHYMALVEPDLFDS